MLYGISNFTYFDYRKADRAARSGRFTEISPNSRSSGIRFSVYALVF